MAVNRVVITGRGAVSPLGIGVAELIEAVWQGRSGVKLMDEWRQIKGMRALTAAPVPKTDAKSLLPRSMRRTMGDMAIHATLAAREAVEDAGLSADLLGSGRVGVAIGSTTGSPAAYETFYEKFLAERSIEELKSGFFFKIMSHSCAANVCLALGITGEQWSPASACSSSAQAMGLGYMLIKSGRQDVVLCGGADEVHHSVTMVFDVLKAASRNHAQPLVTPRPFDIDRDGVVCGGGGGILVLESLEGAEARGAKIHGEILGFGHINDCSHIANPHSNSMSAAMRAALQEAGVAGSEIDYVNAHATGTPQGDIAEAGAILKTVGSKVPVSSFKGHIGHTLGAAGALETIIMLEIMHRQEIIPTLNLENPDPQCGAIALPREIVPRKIDLMIKNNFALGGVNTSLVFQRWH
ncbi:MAG: beta-ketoacyl-[acyl-carrier-protein] synthase family protein [Desulfobulbales bacterium]|nr:beta-ketoacyl-[acyl-carrier-protein] synthase family protein [Desulfobulbales bacterium]